MSIKATDSNNSTLGKLEHEKNPGKLTIRVGRNTRTKPAPSNSPTLKHNVNKHELALRKSGSDEHSSHKKIRLKPMLPWEARHPMDISALLPKKKPEPHNAPPMPNFAEVGPKLKLPDINLTPKKTEFPHLGTPSRGPSKLRSILTYNQNESSPSRPMKLNSPNANRRIPTEEESHTDRLVKIKIDKTPRIKKTTTDEETNDSFTGYYTPQASKEKRMMFGKNKGDVYQFDNSGYNLGYQQRQERTVSPRRRLRFVEGLSDYSPQEPERLSRERHHQVSRSMSRLAPLQNSKTQISNQNSPGGHSVLQYRQSPASREELEAMDRLKGSLEHLEGGEEESKTQVLYNSSRNSRIDPDLESRRNSNNNNVNNIKYSSSSSRSNKNNNNNNNNSNNNNNNDNNDNNNDNNDNNNDNNDNNSNNNDNNNNVDNDNNNGNNNSNLNDSRSSPHLLDHYQSSPLPSERELNQRKLSHPKLGLFRSITEDNRNPIRNHRVSVLSSDSDGNSSSTPRNRSLRGSRTPSREGDSPSKLAPIKLQKSLFYINQAQEEKVGQTGPELPEPIQESEDDPEHRKVFNEDSHNFFEFNLDSKLLRDMKTPDDLRKARMRKVNVNSSIAEIKRDNSTKVYSFAGPDNLIIQPRYMEYIGSMCMTELWSQQQKKEFYHRVRDDIKFQKSLLTDKDVVSVFRPSKLSEQKLVYHKAMSHQKRAPGREEGNQHHDEYLIQLKNEKKNSHFE